MAEEIKNTPEVKVRYSDEELRQIRQMSIRRVMDTNGRLHLGEKGTEWQDLY